MTKDSDNAKNNDYYEKRVQALFWIVCFAWSIYFIFTTLELAGIGEKMPEGAVWVFLALISSYAVSNARLKKKDSKFLIIKPGHYFVYASLFYFLVIFVISFFTGIAIPAHLIEAIVGIVVLFGGTTYYNIQ